MAKRAKKSTKEASDALTAVEEALKIDFGHEAEADADAAADPYASDTSFEVEPKIASRPAIAPSSPPANDSPCQQDQPKTTRPSSHKVL